MPSKFVIPASVTGIATPGGQNKEGAARSGAPSEATKPGGIESEVNAGSSPASSVSRDDNPPQPPVIYSDTTPNGMVISYRPEQEINGVKYSRQYWVNDVEVPSVTTILDVLMKDFSHWGQRIGVDGVLILHDLGEIQSDVDWLGSGKPILTVAGSEASTDAILELMKTHKITVSYVKTKAGDRGTEVHDALEQWAKTGILPDPNDFDEEPAGYVKGLVAFLEDARPVPLEWEVMVGSAEHGFAGRYDLDMWMPEEREIRLTPKRKWQTISPGRYKVDCKSAKDVYPFSNYRQLAAYEGAAVEGGYEPTDGQYVLNVLADGSYQFKKSRAEFEDFLAVLEVYESNQRIK